jgi:hypothetical protein
LQDRALFEQSSARTATSAADDTDLLPRLFDRAREERRVSLKLPVTTTRNVRASSVSIGDTDT